MRSVTRFLLSTSALAVLTLVWLGAFTAQLSAQPAFTVTFGRAFGAIGEPGLGSEQHQTIVGAVEAEHVMAADRLRLYYEFDGGTYATPGDWHYYLHTAGGTWRVKFGSEQQHTVYLGASGSWRANGLSWSAADYRAVGLMANTELRPSIRTTVRFGYRLDARDFPDLSALNQVQHDGFASVLLNLPSRTTLIGELHLGAKTYAGTPIGTSLESVLADSALTGGAGRAGRGMGPSLHAASALGQPVVVAPHAGMVTWLARVAQSLTDRTGASLQYAGRATFGQVAPLVITTPAAYLDDGVYDDPFASDAWTLTASLKHHFASGMVLEGYAARTRKDFSGAVALDAEGVALAGLRARRDRIWRAGAGWTLPLAPSKTGPLSLDLHVDYFFTRHRSNDTFYNYTAHAVGIGATVSY